METTLTDAAVESKERLQRLYEILSELPLAARCEVLWGIIVELAQRQAGGGHGECNF